MLHLIIGGSGSGKSELAEQLAGRLEASNKIYAATMLPYDDDETRARIKKHRLQREGKGFVTIEQPLKLEEIAASKDSVILLECMSNLLANEMFAEEGRIKPSAENAADKYILEPVYALAKHVKDLIIVTNDVFADGREYDEMTGEYVRLLGYVNRKLAKRAGNVVEVVCGIPVLRKGILP